MDKSVNRTKLQVLRGICLFVDDYNILIGVRVLKPISSDVVIKISDYCDNISREFSIVSTALALSDHKLIFKFDDSISVNSFVLMCFGYSKDIAYDISELTDEQSVNLFYQFVSNNMSERIIDKRSRFIEHMAIFVVRKNISVSEFTDDELHKMYTIALEEYDDIFEDYSDLEIYLNDGSADYLYRKYVDCASSDISDTMLLDLVRAKGSRFIYDKVFTLYRFNLLFGKFDSAIADRWYNIRSLLDRKIRDFVKSKNLDKI